MINTDPYADMKPIPGERVYYEWDEEFQCYGVFGERSGFCYGQFTIEQQAKDSVKTFNK